MHITTARLELREYVPDDLEALLAYQNDSRTREFYGPDEVLPEQIPELLRTFLSWAAEEPRRNWQLAVALLDEQRSLVGSAGLRQAGMQPGRAELGIDLAPDVWGQGYGTESAMALLDFGFRRLGLASVRGLTASANVRVASLVQRLGFRFTGNRPGPDWMTQRGWTYAEWELLLDDWVAMTRAGLRATV